MATVTEEVVAVPAVGAGEAEAVMEEKAEEAKEAGAVEKVEELKDAGAVEEKVKDAGAVEEKVEEEKEAITDEEMLERDARKPEEGEQGTAKAKKPRSRKPRSEGPHHPPYFEVSKRDALIWRA
jgi:histone H1/5